MRKHDIRDFLCDLKDSCRDIRNFVKGMPFTDFTKDKKTFNAVIRSLEVIGEATKKYQKI